MHVPVVKYYSRHAASRPRTASDPICYQNEHRSLLPAFWNLHSMKYLMFYAPAFSDTAAVLFSYDTHLLP